jgi:hypothetical protein
MAAPTFDFSDEVIGAAAVPVPVHRKAIIFRHGTIDSVKETAKNITASLSALPAE